MPFKHRPVAVIFVADRALFSVVIEQNPGILNCNISVLVVLDSCRVHFVNGVIVNGFSEESDKVHSAVSCCNCIVFYSRY